jgi:PKD repeat protein
MKKITNSFRTLSLKITIGLCLFTLFSANLISGNIYWIGGTGNWSDATHWSVSSGGASCACVPTATDNVFFDANSFSANGQSLTIDAIASCDNMNWTGIAFSNIMTGSSDLHIYGSLTLISGLNVTNYSGNLYFQSGNIGNTITSAGKIFTDAASINFTGTGNWSLGDAFAANNIVNLTSGTLTTNNNNFTCGTFNSAGNVVRSLILGTSTVTITDCCSSWNITGTNFSLNAGTSLLKFTNTNSYSYLTAGTNDIYYDVLFVDPNTSGNINGGKSSYHNIILNGGGTVNPASGSDFNDITFNGPNNGNVSPGANSIVHNVLFGGNGTVEPGAGSTFNNVSFAGTAYISTSSTTFNDVVFNNTATVYNLSGTFGSANFKNNASITSTTTFDSLLFTKNFTYTLSYGTTQTIVNYFKAIGTCSQLVTIQSSTAGNQATLSKATGTVTANYVTMKDINATGGAYFTTINSTNLSNNTGWVISNPSAQSLYWVNGTGNWSDTAHWSTISGGPSGACIPTLYDNVYFDANSFTATGQSVTVDIIAYCDSMNWAGITNTNLLTGTTDLHVYGSLRLSPNVNISGYTGNLYLQSNYIGTTIASVGKTFACATINLNGTGNWSIPSPFATTGAFNLLSGTFSTNSYSFTCGTFSSTGNNVRSLILGTSTVTITGCCSSWNITGTNFSLNAGTSLLRFTNTNSYSYLTAGQNDVYYDVLFVDPNTSGDINGGGAKFHNIIANGGGSINPGSGSVINDITFNGPNAGSVSPGANSTVHNVIFGGNGTASPGAGCTYNNVSFGGTASISTSSTTFKDVVFTGAASVYNLSGTFASANFKNNGTITANTTFDTLFFSKSYTYILTYNTTQTIVNYFRANGSCSQPISIQSNTAGSQATISKATGTVAATYINMKDLNATGGAIFTAGFSTNISDNTGWAINPPGGQNLYWVGGTGNWSDTSHWSNTSGGLAGACIPTLYDNVHFDANSFSITGQSVTVDITAYCDSISWAGVAYTNTIVGSSVLHIYGSLKLSPLLNFANYLGTLSFEASKIGNTITTTGDIFPSGTGIIFNGSGGWIFADPFTTNGSIALNNGNLTTNNNNFSCGSFNSTGSNARSLILGTSTVTITGCCSSWNISGTNFSLNAGTSLLKFTNTNSYTYLTAGLNDVYYDVLFVDPNISGDINGGGATFHNITINGGGTINPGAGSVFNDITFNGTNVCNVSPGTGSSLHNVICGGNATVNPGTGSTFNNVTFNGTCNMSTYSTKFHDVVFNGVGIAVYNVNGTFTNAIFKNNAAITSNITFDSLTFTKGYTYTLTDNTTQTIIDYFQANGTCSQPVTILSSVSGTQATISEATGMVTANYVSLKDINATGGATFTAVNSINTSDNTGWNFPSANLVAGFTDKQNGLALTFNNTSQFATSYTWKFGDGSTSALQNPIYTYTASGAYNVCLVAKNACGKSDSICQIITVCKILGTGFTDSISGQTVIFTNISQNAIAYSWNFGDGNTSTLTNPVHTYFYGGGYNITLIATNSCGQSDTIHETVSVNCVKPLSGFADNSAGNLVSFVNSSTNAASVLWNYGDGGTSTAFNAPHTYFNSGTYNVCLISKNACGADTLCQHVVVSCFAPVASYSYAVNGMTVNFTNTSSNAAVFNWSFGDAQTSTVANPTHTYSNPGTYTVKVKVNNGCGQDSSKQQLTIICVNPVASFVSNHQDLAVDFVSTSNNATSVVWNFGDGSSISILDVDNHTFSTTGTYNVCLTASNGCGSNTICDSVKVCTPPLANFNYADSARSVSLTNTSTNGISYLWTFGDGNATNITNPKHLYATSGLQTVCLNASNTCGSSTTCQSVKTYCSAFLNQEICMVTTDSTSNYNYNIIYWEKPAVLSGIDSVIVYRFDVNAPPNGAYLRIGAVSKDSTRLVDIARNVGTGSNNGDPNYTSYNYVIALKDSCNNIGPQSLYHQTEHIASASGNFILSPYTINGSASQIAGYDLYRDTIGSGSFAYLTPINGTTATDPNYAKFPKAVYRVDILGFNCTVEGYRLANPNSVFVVRQKSHSNTSRLNASGIDNYSQYTNLIQMYPNPANEQITIECKALQGTIDIQITDVLGNEIKKVNTKTIETTINVGDLMDGVYFVTITNKGQSSTKKLVINK